jgi:hypothetical protein
MGILAGQISRTMLSNHVLGRTPDERQTKRARFVGYMALFFGGLFVIELAFGLVN